MGDTLGKTARLNAKASETAAVKTCCCVIMTKTDHPSKSKQAYFFLNSTYLNIFPPPPCDNSGVTAQLKRSRHKDGFQVRSARRRQTHPIRLGELVTPPPHFPPTGPRPHLSK